MTCRTTPPAEYENRPDIAAGDIPALIYNDRDVFELERERIFGAAWLFLAHEAEIPAAGDYVVRRIVDDSFIVIRDEHGRIRVHFNMCLHRGMQLCRAERGNASHFRCPYHGWSYSNAGELVGVPFYEEESVPLRAARRDAVLRGDQMRRAFEDLLSAECAMGPLVLVLEDLHWGDRSSIESEGLLRLGRG